jgi:hypothetical protein
MPPPPPACLLAACGGERSSSVCPELTLLSLLFHYRYADVENEMKENGRHRNARTLLHKWGMALDLKVLL